MARWTDARMQTALGVLLRVGVVSAAIVAFLGGGLQLWRSGDAPLHVAPFRGEPDGLRSLGGVLHGVAHFDSLAIAQLGLLLLIATPVARVALSLVGFVLERDRKYQIITAVVLAILLTGLAGGI